MICASLGTADNMATAAKTAHGISLALDLMKTPPYPKVLASTRISLLNYQRGDDDSFAIDVILSYSLIGSYLNFCPPTAASYMRPAFVMVITATPLL